MFPLSVTAYFVLLLLSPLVVKAESAKDKEAKITHMLDPEYPDDARSRNIQGSVVLHTFVGTDGKAHDPVAVRGVADSLNWEAIETVKRWRLTLQNAVLCQLEQKSTSRSVSV